MDEYVAREFPGKPEPGRDQQYEPQHEKDKTAHYKKPAYGCQLIEDGQLPFS